MIIVCLVVITLLVLASTFATQAQSSDKSANRNYLRRGLLVTSAVLTMVTVGIFASQQRAFAVSGTTFGSVAVGTPTASQVITVHGIDGASIDTVGLYSSQVLATGGATVDYSDVGGGTCQNGFTFAAANSDSCTVNVVFTPIAVGIRPGAVQVSGGGDVSGTAYFDGIGTGSQVALTPGTITTPLNYTEFVHVQAGVVDGAGNAFVAADDAVLEANAGNNGAGHLLFSGDDGDADYINGTATDARYNNTSGIAIDAAGDLYIADTNNNAIRKIAFHSVTTIAGGPGVSGLDGGPANLASLNAPTSVAVDALGNVYIGDSGEFRIRKIDVNTGIITTVAGSGVSGFGGDGGPATAPAALIGAVSGIAVDAAGDIFFSDATNEVVRKVSNTGTLSTIAGVPGSAGSGGDGGVATSAQLNSPAGLALDAGGDVYIADTLNGSVRRLGAAGRLTTVAGINGSTGKTVVPNAATFTKLEAPVSVSFDSNGTLHIFDTNITKGVELSNVHQVDVATVPALAFGSVAQNRFSAKHTVTVENSGTDPLMITAISSDPGFTVFGTSTCEVQNAVPFPLTLNAGETCKVDIAASPGSGQAAGVAYTGNVTVTTSAGNSVIPAGATATAEPTQLVFVTTPAASVTSPGFANAAGAPITVQEEDATSAPTNSTDTVTLTVTGPASYSATYNATASASGLASFDLSAVSLSAPGQYSYVASVAPAAPAAAITPTPAFSETVTAGTATKFVTSAIPTTVAGGGNLGTITATIEDASGNTVTTSTATVHVTISGPAGFTFTPVDVTAVSGVASVDLSGTALNKPGTYTVTFTSAGLTGPAASTVTVNVGAAVRFVLSAVPATLPAGGNLGTITATVQDAPGNTVTTSTASIQLDLTGPTGFNHAPIFVTAVNGVASFDLSGIPLNLAGTYTVSASTAGLSGPVPSTVTVSVGAGTQFVTSAIPTALNAGGNLGVITATIEDAGGNTVTTSTAPVTLTITGPTNFSFGPTRAVAGVVSFDLSATALNRPGTYTVTLISPGLTGPAATTVVVSVGPALNLVLVNPIPTPIVSGGNLGTITVKITDAGGNTVTTSTAPVTLSIAGPNGFGVASVTNAVAGIAHIDASATVLSTPGTYSVVISDQGLTAPPASTVIVTAGAAAKFVVSAIPSTVVLNGNLGMITATVEDSVGNTVTTSTASIQVAITGPTGFTFTPVSVAAVNGVAVFNLTGTSLNLPGTYMVTFTSAGLTGPAAATVTVTGKIATTAVLTLTPGGAGSAFGVAESLSVIIAPATAGSVNAGGTVQFMDNGTAIGAPVALAAGAASVNLGTPAIGAHSYTAVYSGDTNFATSTSNTIAFLVGQSATTTTLASSANPSAVGASITFTATVASSGTGIPTGTVTFSDGTTVLGTGTLDATGAATFVTSALAEGTHPITAAYGGDLTSAASTSAVLNQVVSAAFVILVNPTDITLGSGDNGFFAVSVNPNPGFSGQVTLSCTNLPATMHCDFFPNVVGAGGQTIEMILRTRGIFQTNQNNGVLNPLPGSGNDRAPVFPALAFWLPGAALSAFGLRRKGMDGRKRNALLLVILMLGMGGMMGLMGCGSGSGPKTPAGTYHINVVGTSGTLTASTPVTVVIK